MNRPHVLVLNSYHPGYIWSDGVMDGIRSVLAETGIDARVFIEHLDTKHHDPAALFPRLALLFSLKYRHPPDLLIVADDNAFDFALRYRKELFPDVPIVFCGIEDFDASLIEGHGRITGILEEVDVAGTIRLISQIQPRLRQIVVLADTTTTSRALVERVRRLGPQPGEIPELVFLTDWSWSELASQLQQLSPNTATLSLTLQRDREGAPLSEKDALQVVLDNSGVPDYSFWDWSIALGSLGGIPSNGRAQGETAAALALRVLQGESADRIPTVRRLPAVPVFNHDQLQRFGMNRDALPEGSLVLGEPESLFSRYRKQIWAIIALVAFQSLSILGLTVNIARRRRAESNLQEEEERFGRLAERAHIIPWEADSKTLNCTFIGPQAVAILGHPLDDWYQRGFWLNRLHRDDRKPAIATLSRLSRERDDFECEYRMIGANGRPVWLQQITHVFRDESGPLRLRGFLLDITSRKTAEDEANQSRERLAHVTRLGTMGEMAAGIAHEINQPLTAVSSYATACQNLIRAGRFDDPDLLESLEKIRSGAHRAGDVIGRLRNFVKKHESERIAADLNDLVSESVGLIESDARLAGITIDFSPGDSLPQVLADPIQIQQVVLNLVRNGIEAMLTINAEDPMIAIETTAVDEGYVEVSVSDRGPGIKPEDADRILDPFFSTKTSGLGMGLAISRSIVLAHGGRFWFELKTGGGTTFFFTLETAGDEESGRD